ncbi:aminopeptidase N [uncultured Microbulbifer sp.]|uniref:aminopeptidase N n=1 Tax=uncultured Microbulbifer sp. TaxID=348147 RepID=UPI0026252DC6|nr:aminopeptidase N [uncultured Microbulbifer sp.]
MIQKYKLAGTKLAITLAYSIILAACGEKSAPQDNALNPVTGSPLRVETAGLSENYAKLRKQQITKVDYQLSVHLDSVDDHFSGTMIAEVDFNRVLQQPLTIDFSDGTVESVKVDGQERPFDYNGHFIRIAPAQLPKQQHKISVNYRHPYSNNGSGLHRFKDPIDDKVYMYTDFEPYDANRLFPHFDQPNLKARYTLDVTAPKDWIVISAERENRIEEMGELNHWFFPQTQKFSSYIFSLHAGPYHVWEDDAEGIPLRLMARQSLAKYVKTEDWFTFTKQSFEFFQPYFEIDYPFQKYDQILVPDFNAGAMENVGSVTFNDTYVSRGEKTQAQRMRLANVIAHELAHQWFGNLVTMNWWDDLWLNESFATYMANLSLAENSEFTNAWENFYLGTKQWAYHSDQRPTTHAIQLPVRNTDEAFANFDGITYGKGGSVLKQLPYYLGKEEFRKGVSNYLKELSYQNSTLDDFIGHLGKAAGINLDNWQQQWLYQAGLNTIEASFQCENAQISSLTLKQSAPEAHPTLREQRTQLGFYRMDGESMKRYATLPVLYSGAITKVKEAKGLPCPQILYPNEGDWAFAKVNLDTVTVQNMAQHINSIEQPFARLMLWQSLFDSTYDAKLPLDEYISFIINNGAVEQDINAIRLNARYLSFVYSYLNQIPIDKERRTELRLAIEEFVWQQLQQASGGSDQQKVWFGIFTSVAHSLAALNNAKQMLMGELAIEGLTLDPDMRWELISLQNRYLFSDYEEAITRELEKDSSDRSNLNAIAAEAIRPLPETKKKWLDNLILNRDKFKLSELRRATSSLFTSEQIELFNHNRERIFAALEQINNEDSSELISTYAYMFPLMCSKEGAQKISATLEGEKPLKPMLIKAFKNHRYTSERCIKMGQTLLKHQQG